MAGFDAGGVYYSYQRGAADPDDEGPIFSRKQAQEKFSIFINNFYPTDEGTNEQGVLIYREQLLKNKDRLLVDLQHVKAFDNELGQELEDKPTEYLPLMEAAAAMVLREHSNLEEDQDEQQLAEVQVMLYSTQPFGPVSIRELTSDRVMKLVMLPGIITAQSKPKYKATYVTLQCRDCKQTMRVACKPGLGGAFIPRTCTLSQGVPGAEKCSLDPFYVLPEKSKYIDQQSLKLQERPEDVPTGDLPRTLMLVADRHLVGRVIPGTRVTVVGIYSTAKQAKGGSKTNAMALQQPYVRVVGLVESGDVTKSGDFTDEERAQFMEFSKQPNVHGRIFDMMAPNIFGSENIKKALACLLFGGSRKTMPDNTTRKGDINVLLLGDPSTAKSQFLKFASKVAPTAVYTSGKGSSAAGLTASVIQDPNTREFYLEGGAMVLADNGVVCIDEFDKMRPEDRVAIHEAMEQQTISIAKAGITTMLKSRASVLAAANPPSGRYDDLKSAQDNIDLQSTILSRFDLIFLVKDTLDRDKELARYVLDTHAEIAGNEEREAQKTEKERWLKRYIQFCRMHYHPRLNDGAKDTLAGEYVKMRGAARQAAQSAQLDQSPIPITVRQLEAIIRISESLARMCMQTEATLEHVEMAKNLFNVSTMDAVKAEVATIVLTEEQRHHMQRLEDRIKERLHINGRLPIRNILDTLISLGEAETDVYRALHYLTQRGELSFQNERRVVRRLK